MDESQAMAKLRFELATAGGQTNLYTSPKWRTWWTWSECGRWKHWLVLFWQHEIDIFVADGYGELFLSERKLVVHHTPATWSLSQCRDFTHWILLFPAWCGSSICSMIDSCITTGNAFIFSTPIICCTIQRRILKLVNSALLNLKGVSCHGFDLPIELPWQP